jgi:hypothetical protein
MIASYCIGAALEKNSHPKVEQFLPNPLRELVTPKATVRDERLRERRPIDASSPMG